MVHSLEDLFYSSNIDALDQIGQKRFRAASTDAKERLRALRLGLKRNEKGRIVQDFKDQDYVLPTPPTNILDRVETATEAVNEFMLNQINDQ